MKVFSWPCTSLIAMQQTVQVRGGLENERAWVKFWAYAGRTDFQPLPDFDSGLMRHRRLARFAKSKSHRNKFSDRCLINREIARADFASDEIIHRCHRPRKRATQ
jgi:hypothetical protein